MKLKGENLLASNLTHYPITLDLLLV